MPTPPAKAMPAVRSVPAQRVADRDQRAEHDQDRPIDGVIGLAQSERPHEQDAFSLSSSPTGWTFRSALARRAGLAATAGRRRGRLKPAPRGLIFGFDPLLAFIHSRAGYHRVVVW